SRAGVFADTPLVFFSSRPVPRTPTHSTGGTAPGNLRDTLTLALEMQPDVARGDVVNGTDKADEDIARAQVQSFESRVSFTYLSGLETTELDAHLSSLPSHSIVYYVYVSRDTANDNFNPLEYLSHVTSVANAPTYCWIDSAMGRGIVGGSLRSLSAQTAAIGLLRQRGLRREPADSIPAASLDLNVSQVDWRQLRRWGISEARVPAGTLVRFRDPSVWDRYRVYILSALTLMLAQTALIAGLLYQRRARQRAEVESRRNLALAADANRPWTMFALTGSMA